MQQLQHSKLLLTKDITAAELDIKYLKQQNHKQQQNEQQYQQQYTDAKRAINDDQQALTLSKQKLQQQQAHFKIIETDIAALKEKIEHTQQWQQQAQLQWQESQQQQQDKQQQSLALNTQMATETAIIEQLSQQQQQLEKQLEQIAICEQSELDNQQLKVEELAKQHASLQQEQQALQQQIEELHQQVEQQKQQVFMLEVAIKNEQQQLTSLQEKSNKRTHWQIEQNQWLAKQSLQVLGVLKQQLKVDDNWQQALDTVLAFYLDSEIVNQWPQANDIGDLAHAPLRLLRTSSNVQAVNDDKDHQTLASKVSGAGRLQSFLQQIFIADNYQQALAMLSELSEQQSVICRDGTWLSQSFLYKGKLEQQESFFEQQQHLENRKQQLTKDEQQLAIQKEQLAAAEQALMVQQQLAAQKQNQLTNAQAQFVQAEQQQQLLLQQRAQQLQQQQSVNEQIHIVTEKRQKAEHERATLAETLQQLESCSLNDDKLPSTHIELSDTLTQLQLQNQQLLQQRQDSALQVQQYQHSCEQLSKSIEAHQQVLIKLSEQESNTSNQNSEQQKLLVLEDDLQHWLAQLATTEQQLILQQSQLQESLDNIERIEKAIKAAQKQIGLIDNKLSQLSLDHESYKLRAENALEGLAQTPFSLEHVIAQMPHGAKENIWQAKLQSCSKDISQLGAINLAAIDEYEAQLQRMHYLTQQNSDLTEAIATLESAINKIDKKTRDKFKITFEQVNNDLQQLFPKVFGGGQAYLALTSDDLLESGVSIMARPPGKKNSTIHLLSGGEKALTALSLVFRYFSTESSPVLFT